MKTKHVLAGVALGFCLQSPDVASAAEASTTDVQNATLRATLDKAPKLPLGRTLMRLRDHEPDALAGVVSWVSTAKSGLIYLLQRGDKLDPVIVMDRNGGLVRSWGKGMYVMPHAIRVDPQGNVWTVDAASSMVYKFSPEGDKLMEIEVGGQPWLCTNNFCSTTDIAFAPGGNLFIADGYRNARILEYTPQGKKIREWGSAGDGPGQFKLPHSIEIDENGIIYVADRENGRIQRFELQGKYLGEWPQFGKPFGLKLDDKGAIFLTSIPRGPNVLTGWVIKLGKR